MRSLLLNLICLLMVNMRGQSIFWYEDFGTGCNQGQIANGTVTTPTNGAWVVTSTGLNDPYSNEWYISATEAGMGLGNCQDGCLNNSILSNRTLHIGNVAVNTLGLSSDQGAAYLDGACGMGYCSNTDKRVESPTINCTGYNNITLSFNYIQMGTNGSDFIEVMYFDGISWVSFGNLPQTYNNNICGNIGIWSNYSISLPSAADNNSNVKIGFRWQNIDDGIATDPSFAVDDIQINGYPIQSVSFNQATGKNSHACPNPNNGTFVISTNSSLMKTIRIMDITGRVIVTTQSDEKDIEMDIANYSRGIYVVEIESEIGIDRINVVKE
ncbi:MAG: hypothetical protein KatS3mg027_0543 [Bacteroidia bacterium]|nr:MAG: hypothetical protein KatS3mg027_0543 [Bacteroidia bacterium]